MKSIQIEQQFGQIGMKITPPDLKLRLKHPDLNLQITQPNLELAITKPEVSIDLRDSFNSMGLKDISTSMRDFVADAKDTIAKGIEQTVANTKALEDPKGPSVVDLAYQDSRPEEKQLVIGLMPSVSPRISAKLGSVQGTYTPGSVQAKLNPGEIGGDFTWGTVDVYMEREPYIDIKV
jgi:hypothetical protein